MLRLQQAIWGFADIELLPLRFLVVVSKVGGHVFGAYDGDMMVGFCFAIPGIKPGGRPYLHSHMLGVLPAYRNAGVGRSLKLKQREEALARGIELIEWTFDPLELKNAFFNIERLGAIVRRYHENQYGITVQPAARRTAHRPLLCRMVDRHSAGARRFWTGAACRRRRAMKIGYPADIARIRARRSAPRPPHSEGKRRKIPPRLRAGAGGHALRARRDRRQLPAGALAMKIERVTLRQIAHAAGAFLRDQLQPHHRAPHDPGGSGGRRRLRMGRSDRRRKSLLQRGVDRLGVADAARLRHPARARAANSPAPRTFIR